MMKRIVMKPETIARRLAEQTAREAKARQVFLKTYAVVRAQFPELPVEPPVSGSRFSAELADGRYLNISVDRWQVF